MLVSYYSMAMTTATSALFYDKIIGKKFEGIYCEGGWLVPLWVFTRPETWQKLAYKIDGEWTAERRYN